MYTCIHTYLRVYVYIYIYICIHDDRRRQHNTTPETHARIQTHTTCPSARANTHRKRTNTLISMHNSTWCYAQSHLQHSSHVFPGCENLVLSLPLEFVCVCLLPDTPGAGSMGCQSRGEYHLTKSCARMYVCA